MAEAFGLRHGFSPELQEVYEGFGLDLNDSNGEAGWTLPIPGRFVVGRDGVIVDAVKDPDYTHRPEVDDTLAVVRGM